MTISPVNCTHTTLGRAEK